MPSHQTKKRTKSKQTPSRKKPPSRNIYTNHFHHMGSSAEKSKLVELTNLLKDNQWLKVAYTDPDEFNLTRHNTSCANSKSFRADKPPGTWYSKGEWIFHDMNETLFDPDSTDNNDKIERYISLVEVDYSKIYRITNSTPSNEHLDAGYWKSLKTFESKYCKNTKLEKSTTKWFIPDWKEICSKYHGFAIYPFPPYEYMVKFNEAMKNNPNNHLSWMHFLISWDVSSLVIWNMNDVILKSHNLGSVKEIGNIKNIISKIRNINKN